VSAAASLLLQSKISEQFSGVVDDYLPLNTAHIDLLRGKTLPPDWAGVWQLT